MNNKNQDTKKDDYRISIERLKEIIEELELDKSEITQTIVLRLGSNKEEGTSSTLSFITK